MQNTKKVLHIWVGNMDAVGADADYTTDYLRAVSAGDLAAHFHCHIEGQLLHGRASDIWPCFRCLSQRISDAGHGGDTQGAPAPILVARLPDADGAAATLQELESVTAPDWDTWVAASLIEIEREEFDALDYAASVRHAILRSISHDEIGRASVPEIGREAMLDYLENQSEISDLDSGTENDGSLGVAGKFDGADFRILFTA